MKTRYNPNTRENAQTPEEIKAESSRLAKIRADATRRNALYHMFTSIETNCPDSIGISISLRGTSDGKPFYVDFRQDYQISSKTRGKK
jgi:hypothetical protein